MGDFPQARFLPQKPLLILPRQSSRQRRETPQRPSTAQRWASALVIVFIVIGSIAFAVGWMWAIGVFE